MKALLQDGLGGYVTAPPEKAISYQSTWAVYSLGKDMGLVSLNYLGDRYRKNPYDSFNQGGQAFFSGNRMF